MACTILAHYLHNLVIPYSAGVSPFTPLKGLFIQGPIFASFFFAVSVFFPRLFVLLLYVLNLPFVFCLLDIQHG